MPRQRDDGQQRRSEPTRTTEPARNRPIEAETEGLHMRDYNNPCASCHVQRSGAERRYETSTTLRDILSVSSIHGGYLDLDRKLKAVQSGQFGRADWHAARPVHAEPHIPRGSSQLDVHAARQEVKGICPSQQPL
jgi:hypothetical protein